MGRRRRRMGVPDGDMEVAEFQFEEVGDPHERSSRVENPVT